MSNVLVKAVVPATEKNGLKANVVGEANYNFPDSLEAAASQLGEDVALAILNQQIRVKVQAVMRQHMVSKGEDGKLTVNSDVDLQGVLDGYTPGAPKEKKSTTAKFIDKMAGASDEELQSVLAEIKRRREEGK